MRNPYPMRLTTLFIASTFGLVSYGQSPKPATSAEIKLTEFAMPPFPTEVIGVKVEGGGLQVISQMPIAGRPLPQSETPKPRGAQFPSSAAYFCRQTLDAQGQPTAPAQGMVFAQAVPSAQPADFAVFGTRAADGPMRLPLGGGLDGLPGQFPEVAQPRTQVSLMSTGSPRYEVFSRGLDPVSGRLVNRVREGAPQRVANAAKLTAYSAIPSTDPAQVGRVIALSPTRYEGIATRNVEGDKNASARRVNLLSFDEAGNLLHDQPVAFAYNRALTARLPVHDSLGRVVGSLNIFGDGPGKKDVQDPEENRFSVVVTDEEGKIWSQFEWTAGGSSGRAGQLLLYSVNGQKMLKSVYESWAFSQSGQATLLGSMPEGDLRDYSKAVGRVNRGEPIGWFFFNSGNYLDSFTDATGSVWVLMQRHAPRPTVPDVIGETEAEAPAPAATSAPASAPNTLSKMVGWANRMKEKTSGVGYREAPAPVPPSKVPVNIPNDVFVLRFDDKLRLQSETVVAVNSPENGLRLNRLLRPTGATYVLGDAVSTRLQIRDTTLQVRFLALPDERQPVVLGRSHTAFDKAGGRLFLLTELPQKPGTARLNTYPLD